MERDFARSMKVVKYSAIAVSGLMLAGIATLMFISRGKGEDITGIVAPALLIAGGAALAATIAAVVQRRAQKAIDQSLHDSRGE